MKWQLALWAYYVLAALFTMIGLVLIGWEKDLPGIAGVLLAAILVSQAESCYTVLKEEEEL